MGRVQGEEKIIISVRMMLGIIKELEKIFIRLMMEPTLLLIVQQLALERLNSQVETTGQQTELTM